MQGGKDQAVIDSKGELTARTATIEEKLAAKTISVQGNDLAATLSKLRGEIDDLKAEIGDLKKNSIKFRHVDIVLKGANAPAGTVFNPGDNPKELSFPKDAVGKIPIPNEFFGSEIRAAWIGVGPHFAHVQDPTAKSPVVDGLVMPNGISNYFDLVPENSPKGAQIIVYGFVDPNLNVLARVYVAYVE